MPLDDRGDGDAAREYEGRGVDLLAGEGWRGKTLEGEGEGCLTTGGVVVESELRRVITRGEGLDDEVVGGWSPDCCC